jgi:hypothetical protein
MDVTGRSVSSCNSACVEEVEPDQEFSAEVLAMCRRLFAVGAAKGSQNVEKHLGCSLEVLKGFEDFQLLEQVRPQLQFASGSRKLTIQVGWCGESS